MRLPRLITMLLASGVTLLIAAILLSTLPAHATERMASPPNDGWYYTSRPSPVSAGRVIDLYVDTDFSEHEKQSLVSAMRQWNYVLNGFVWFRARMLPVNPEPALLAQIRRSHGWVIARVDSRHPVARSGEGTHALAVTTGSRGGFVYVISDRMGNRDFTGVMMHEFGHVLGAGHDGFGLMAPVYSAAMGRCIDQDAVALVARAQRLPMNHLNWCEGPAVGRPPLPMAQVPHADYRTPMAARQR
ncbi:MAG TPA: hypothetical protein VEC60_17990 [Reyranella sp.]|nr:hypothetical protein [Reyranella sp.]